jgi:SAM-dependent methyltransferase
MVAERVLDVGCGTGTLLHRAREAGHVGRLCGLDPDPAILRGARGRTDIECVLADTAPASWSGEFDLAVMTGHAFQVLITDDDLRTSLSAIRAALVDGGRFAFETRHPQARAWDGWSGSFERTNPDGDVVEVSCEVREVTGDVVWVAETLSVKWWEEPQTEVGALRFLALEALTAFLHDAGFAIDDQFGDWQCGQITDVSEEIITIARRT